MKRVATVRASDGRVDIDVKITVTSRHSLTSGETRELQQQAADRVAAAVEGLRYTRIARHNTTIKV